MNRISKLAILNGIVLFAIIYIWMYNPLLALIMASIGVVPAIRNIFEIKKYHNRNLYLALSTVVLFVGIISTGIWVFNQDELLNKTITGVAAGLLILSTFQTAFTRTRKWDKVRVH